ncbi:MAG: M23 family metallopeptidase [Gammaproteobacteria bacterium]|nr:M23 family metallopeptidase [Gammaproteobacteria bacterium]
MLNSFFGKSLFFTAILLVAFSLFAGEVYKWQDEDGIWHFSSMPPDSDEKFDTLDMPADPRPMVSMRKLGINREPEYVFFNNIWGPVELELELNDAENITSEPPLPNRFVLPGQTEKRLLKIKATDPGEGFGYRLSYSQMIGPPLDKLPAEVDYYPPFPLGLEFPISQGFDNDETHSKPPNQYAVDIVMPVGTPILAARGGVIMDLQENFQGGGKQKRYLTRANQVRILHDDGTMAVYAHLQRNSVRVQRGARVATGHWIANSGNTGYSSGPHLHFVVQLNAGMSLESLPFRFVAPTDTTMTPGERKMIDGVLPKK